MASEHLVYIHICDRDSSRADFVTCARHLKIQCLFAGTSILLLHLILQQPPSSTSRDILRERSQDALLTCDCGGCPFRSGFIPLCQHFEENG